MKRAPMPDGSGEGWTWKFDPFLWGKLDRSAMQARRPDKYAAPMAQIFGDRSAIMQRREWRGSADFLPAGVPQVAIPDSRAPHHGRPAAGAGGGASHPAGRLAELSVA